MPEQACAHQPADVYAWLNTQDDTAGSTILHQQLTLVVSVVPLTVVMASDVPYTASAFWLEHIAIPLNGTLVSFVMHVADQSALPAVDVDVHVVVDASNATHFCTAVAGITSITPTTANVKSFFICLSPLLVFREKTKTTRFSRVVRRLTTINMNCAAYSIYSQALLTLNIRRYYFSSENTHRQSHQMVC